MQVPGTTRTENPREAGIALLFSLVMMLALLMMTALSLELTKTHALVNRSEESLFMARQGAESALAQALARMKDGGQLAPVSGDGTSPVWIAFGGGEFYYETTVDLTTEISTITAWSRIPVASNPSGSPFSPDNVAWDGRGYVLQGLELLVKGRVFIPSTPLFLGNGGIQRPLGGVEWVAGTDPFDPNTWQKVSSSPESTQRASVDMELSALDYPYDYLTNGGTPVALAPGIHPYSLLVSKNPVGQQNARAWMDFSAGGTAATAGLSPSPLTSYSTTSTDADYAYPIDESVPDVQDYIDVIWNQYSSGASANLLTGGSLSGTYGSVATPQVTIVTGGLQIDAGDTFSGAGILVIRDDFDPNIDVNTTPTRRAFLDVLGTLEWSGLVVIAGWNPYVEIKTSGNATIVGALMAEDSVMSMGETSLATSMIWFRLASELKILYSSDMFEPGGIVYESLPGVRKEVIGVRELMASYGP